MNTQTDKTKNPKPKPSKLVASYTLAAQSASTKRSYAQDVQHFKANAKIVFSNSGMSLKGRNLGNFGVRADRVKKRSLRVYFPAS